MYIFYSLLLKAGYLGLTWMGLENKTIVAITLKQYFRDSPPYKTLQNKDYSHSLKRTKFKMIKTQTVLPLAELKRMNILLDVAFINHCRSSFASGIFLPTGFMSFLLFVVM